MDVWFGEDERTNTIKTHVQKRLDKICKISLNPSHLIVNSIGRARVFN